MSLFAYLTEQHWAMEERALAGAVLILNRHFAGVKMDASAIVQAIGRDPQAAGDTAKSYAVINGVAIVPVQGVIAKYANQVNGACQPSGTSAERLQAQLRQAAADPDVRSILVAADSPGGTVAGTPDTASLIREIAKTKDVIGHIGDLGASACYWIISGCTKVYANQNALVGSLGVVSRLVDASVAAEKDGIKVHILRSVALKAPGQPGEAISPEQIADSQRVINELHAQFTSAVKAARPGVSDAAFTGQVFLPTQAQALGLIDGVRSYEQLLAELTAASTPVSTTTQSAPRAGNSTMKLSAEVLAALIIAHTAHAALITSSAQAGKDEAAIRGEISAADQKIIGDLRAALAAEQDAHTKTKAKLEGDLAAMTKKHDDLAKLGRASIDPGSDPTVTGDAGVTGPEATKAKWDADSKVRAFFHNDYAIFETAVKEDGLAKVLAEVAKV